MAWHQTEKLVVGGNKSLFAISVLVVGEKQNPFPLIHFYFLSVLCLFSVRLCSCDGGTVHEAAHKTCAAEICFFFLFFSVDESQRTLWLRRPPAHTNSQRRAYIYIGSFVFGACIHSNMTYACRTLFFVSLCVLFGWHICVSGDLCPLHM